MENDKNIFEKDDDTNEMSDGKKTKSSKYGSKSKEKIYKESKTNSNEDIDITKNNNNDRQELASFFKKRQDKILENDKEFEALEDEEPNLTEEEVHEATLVIVDARNQEISEELENSEPDSIEELVALANAVFLEELEDITEQCGNITEESIDQAFEAANDLVLNQDQEVRDLDNNYINDDSSNENGQEKIDNGNIIGISSGSNMPPNNPNNGHVSFYQNQPSPLAGNYSSNNNVQTSPISETIRTETIVESRRSDMLVGAVIGYIIGRRGGRKRAEKKLQPKITKLEKQVLELYYFIADKEEKIRNLARQKAEEYERRKRAVSNNENTRENTHTASVADEVIERRILKKKVKEKIKKREELSQDPTVEKIGKFSLPALKVFHERRIPDGAENSPERIQVEVMSESELLEKVENLFIEGISVKKAYKEGRLNKENLRQITKEYLRGGPYRQTFLRELKSSSKELETSREKINSKYSDTRNDLVTKGAKETKHGTVISKEEAMRRADALIKTSSSVDKVSNLTENKNRVAVFTLLAVIISIVLIFIIS
jgi:hypothetical protein